jgi:hypothetical protein
MGGAAGSDGKTGATGDAGAAGADGKTGPKGESGSTGAAGGNGAPGATGATGATGTNGAAGVTGPPGLTGPSGASAPTFSATSAGGVANQTSPVDFEFFAVTALVPAGPTLVGFSVGLTHFAPPSAFTCSLVDAVNPATIFATTASLDVPGAPLYATFATTEVVTLAQATNLTINCTANTPTPDFLYYQSLSVYAISFATP